MGRDAKGYIRFAKGKHLAFLRSEYLGSFSTREEAQRKIAATLDIDSDKAPDSLRLFGERWLNERDEGGDVRDIKNERSVWKTHIATAHFADWPVKRIRPVDVKKWIVAMSKKHKLRLHRRKVDGIWVSTLVETDKRISKETVTHARRILLGCFKEAAVDGKCASNPVRDVPVPKMARVREEEDEWSYLRPDEIARLFARIEQAKRKEFYRAVFAVAIYAGLREGEIWGLRWRDIKPNEIQVRMSFREPVKAESSHRSVPMLRPVRDALDAWRKAGGAVQLSGLVFTAPSGSNYADGYDANWATQWRKKAGCASHVRFHDLRHTCGSHLLMGTWGRAFKLTEIKDWLGHADITTTQRYAHLAPGALAGKVREMEGE